MKILAIRGKNLASLAGPFAVDFCQEPLASAGLFAISGPTGAGKSTLLDALCLSLYDNTPRLLRAETYAIDEGLSHRDTRNLLSRGQSEAWAETDFKGCDNRIYRARWSVRRARGQSGGALQNSEMSLKTLPDGPALGRTKTEVKAAIEACLGLSFTQFTRAVLLAQNEFATFLKADDSERAELLQTLTGSDIYSAVSRQAHQRLQQEKERLQGLVQQLDGLAVLEPDERDRLMQEKTRLESDIRRQDAELAQLESRLLWHRQWQESVEQERRAGASLQQAREACAALAERREHYRLVESVQAIRPLLQDYDRETEAEQEAVARDEQARCAAVEATRQRDERQEAVTAQTRALTELRHQQASVQPETEAARGLDHLIATLQQQVGEWQMQGGEAGRECGHLADHLTALREEQARLQQSLAGVDTELQARAGWEPLVTGWTHWTACLQQAALLWHALQAETAPLELLQSRLVACQTAWHQAQAQRVEQETRLDRLDSTLNQIVLPMSHAAMEQARNECKQWRGRREHLQDARLHWEKRKACMDALQQLEQQSTASNAEILRAEQGLRQITDNLPTLQAALEQARRSLKIAELSSTGTAQELSRHLRPGEACPVCGSLDHPGHFETVGGDEVLKRLAEEVEILSLELSRLQQEHSALEALCQYHWRQQDEWGMAFEAHSRTLYELDECWLSHPARHEMDHVADGVKELWCQDALSGLQRRMDLFETRERGWQLILTQQESARQQRDHQFIEVTRARDAETGAAHALERAQDALQVSRVRRDEALQNLQNWLEPLDAVMPDPDWRNRWKQDTTAFHAALSRDIEAHEGLTEQKNRLSEACRVIQMDIEPAQQALLRARERFDVIDTRWKLAEAQRDARVAERQALLNGLSVDVFESTLKAACQSAEQVLSSLETARQAAETVLTREKTREEATGNERLARQLARQRADEALQNGLSLYAQTHTRLDIVRLRDLLQPGQAWLKEERLALQAVDEAHVRAEAVHQTARSRQAALELSRPDTESREGIERLKTEQAAQRESWLAEHARVGLILQQDEALQQKQAEAGLQVSQQTERLRVWSQLGDLIGSADGKKFRNYAQQMTLDILLGYANRHLEQLARRYRLERVFDKLALRVVDQDMGDEMRSVHSLSGGESFLVSLALALGLASLSSHRVQVESLFIDEGFGSLDAETLDIAMNALDNLNAQGRKVGVISHVREMTDRIGTCIRVRRLAGGLSRIAIEG